MDAHTSIPILVLESSLAAAHANVAMPFKAEHYSTINETCTTDQHVVICVNFAIREQPAQEQRRDSQNRARDSKNRARMDHSVSNSGVRTNTHLDAGKIASLGLCVPTNHVPSCTLV